MSEFTKVNKADFKCYQMPDGSTYYGTLVNVIPTDPSPEGENATPDITRPGSVVPEAENALSKERLSILRSNSRLVD